MGPLAKLLSAGLGKKMAKSTSGKSVKKTNAANSLARDKTELSSMEKLLARTKKTAKHYQSLKDKVIKLKHSINKTGEAPKAKESMTMPSVKQGPLVKDAKDKLAKAAAKKPKSRGYVGKDYKPIPDFLKPQVGLDTEKSTKKAIKGSSHTPAMLKKQAY